MGRRLLLLALAMAISLSTSVRAQTAMAVDGPANNATVAQPFWITGWAVDTAAQSGTGIDYVHVWGYPNPGSNEEPIFFGAAELGGSRPDVAAVYGSQFTNSGFGFQVIGRAPKTYELVVYAHSAVSGFTDERHVTVNITANPAMSIDGPTQNADVLQPFNVGGWAVDRAAATGTGVDTVHVYAFPGSGGDPIFIGASYMGGDRPDVAAVFGSRFAPSGFNVTFNGQAAGTYQIMVYAHSAVSNSFSLAQGVTVNVDPRASTPTFSLASGTYYATQATTISTTTSNATVRYTTDGTEPTCTSSIASGSVDITTSQTIKAKACRDGWLASVTATAAYVLQTVTPAVAPSAGPVFAIGQILTFSVNDSYATIRYTTNGTDPTESSPSIGSGQSITLNEPASVQARAFRTGFVQSSAVGGQYTLKLPTPALSPLGGEFSSGPTVSMSQSPAVSGVTYRYTLNGDEPSSSSNSTTGNLSVPLESTLSVKAQKSGWADSETTTEVYVSDTPPPMSAGTITASSVAATGFVAVGGLARFTMVGASLTSSTDDIAVYRDSTALPVTLINASTFDVGGLVDGRNEIDIFGVDSQGLPFEGYATVWAGNRTVTVTTVSPSGAPLPGIAVAGRLSDDEAMAATATSASNGVSLLTATPTAYGLHVEATAPGYRLAETTIAPNATSVTLTVEDENHDFSRGGAGWTSTSPNISLRAHDEDTFVWYDCPTCPIRFVATGAIGNSVGSTGCPTAFTDDPLVPGETPLKRVHVIELRGVIDCLRQQHGLGTFSWAGGLTSGVTPVNASHLSELRVALAEVFAAAGLPAPPYTDATLPGAPLKAVHMMELRALVAPSNAASAAGTGGTSNDDLLVETMYLPGTQTVTRRFHAYGGTSTVTVKYRFGTQELKMGLRAQDDMFVVRLRNVSASAPAQCPTPTATCVEDVRSVTQLAGQWRSDSSTAWRTRALSIADGQEIEITLAVTNIGDAYVSSGIEADFVQEARVIITGFELYDDNLDPDGTEFERLDHFLSVSNWPGNPSTIKLNGRLSVKTPLSATLQAVTLEVIEGGQVKTSTPLSQAGSGILGQNPVNGLSIGTAFNPVKPLFEFSPNQLASSVNQTTDGEVELRIRVTASGGLSAGMMLPRKINKLVWYSVQNRYGRTDPLEGNTRELSRCYPPPAGNPLCRGDSWARPSTAARAASVADLAYGDFSNMNGGYFPPHNSHRDGRDTDTMWWPNPLAQWFAVTRPSANRMIALFNSAADDLIDFVYVTMEPATDFWTTIRDQKDSHGEWLIPRDAATEFETEYPSIRALPISERLQDQRIRRLKIFRNGRLRWEKGHVGHFHIRWR